MNFRKFAVDYRHLPQPIFAMFALSILLSAIATPACADNVADGRRYYLRYCASCHGESGDGNGPVAKVLKDQPADLRKLGASLGMPLPAARLSRFIDGREAVAAHGPRTMPVWGDRFPEIYEAKGSPEGDLPSRIRKIIDYLNSIQEKPAPNIAPKSH
ncbi:MAG TPA: cytochrome c [Candidatus Binataceae bacterium]|nr:cytochrome c [Candidatus Binataceae bacterium]